MTRTYKSHFTAFGLVTNPKLLYITSIISPFRMGYGGFALNLIPVGVTVTVSVSVVSIGVTVVSLQSLGRTGNVGSSSMTVVGEVSISCGVSLGFTFVNLRDAVGSGGGADVLERTSSSVVSVVRISVSTVVSQTVVRIAVSVGAAVVSVPGISGGFGIGISLGLALVDLGDTVAGSGGVYALEGRSTGNGVVVRSISIGDGSIRSEELRFSFGLPLVVSAESVSAIGITVVSTIFIISTVNVFNFLKYRRFETFSLISYR